MLRRSRLPLLLLILSLWAARAQAANVVIVRPAGAAAAASETVARLEGELLSLGLSVTTVEAPAPEAPTPIPESVGSLSWRLRMHGTAKAHKADAAVEVIGDTSPVAVDIWVEAGHPGRAEPTRVALEPDADNPPQRLAIRAVEVLRSSLVEIDLAARGRPAAGGAREPEAAALAAPAPEPALRPAAVDVEVGTGLLTSLDGVGPAWLPLIQLGWEVPSRPSSGSSSRSWLVLQAAVAGFGSRPTLAAPAGTARVAQQFAVVGACSCVRTARALQPFVSLAAGVLRTAIEGQADPPDVARSVEQWAFLVDAGAGARVRLWGRLHATAAAHLHLAEPYVAVHLADTLVATSGRPNLLFTLTLGTWL
ncbi:MAG TPA: hypothetical protein VHM31_02375 [Polyangia bacterium]|nr:hypothetical protein [Polyangia bacterium]